MNQLPLKIKYAKAPPIKCQGIKTKLVPFIFSSITWTPTEAARWIEPFLGSGVVAFNLASPRALLADTNQHIIAFYRAIQSGELTAKAVRDFLVLEGKQLAVQGADYYYEVRERFNTHGSPYDFLFLNRSCFNGVMRFNWNSQLLRLHWPDTRSLTAIVTAATSPPDARAPCPHTATTQRS